MSENGDSVLTVLNVLILLGLIIIGWLIKSYIPSYLNKKAENFATKEDFRELLEMEKVTTKEIELIRGKISTEVWVDQRRWDLKRELYSKLLEVFHELRKTTANVATTYLPNQDKEFIERNREFYDKQKRKQLELVEEAGRLVAVSALVIDKEAINAVDQFRIEASFLTAETDPYKYMMGLCDSADRVIAYYFQKLAEICWVSVNTKTLEPA